MEPPKAGWLADQRVIRRAQVPLMALEPRVRTCAMCIWVQAQRMCACVYTCAHMHVCMRVYTVYPAPYCSPYPHYVPLYPYNRKTIHKTDKKANRGTPKGSLWAEGNGKAVDPSPTEGQRAGAPSLPKGVRRS